MKLLGILLQLVLASSLVAATPADDMENLRTTCETNADTIDASLSNAAALNTSDLIQMVIWQIGACVANLDPYNASTTPPTSSNTTGTYDMQYLDYTDALLTLSESVLRRGMAPHQEMNEPVFNALQSLNSVVQSYGMQLGNDNLISRSAYVRTLTAGSSITDAESVWSGERSSSPGMKTMKRLLRRI